MAPLVQGLDGNLYGTTLVGGGHGQGSIFRIGTSGAFATVYSFCAVANCADGFNPEAGLVLSESGDLYGTTTDLFYGKIFKITPSGTLTVLHDFRSDGVYVRMVASPTGSFAPPMGISGEPRKGAEPPNTARSSRSARMVT
jgi:uncharacterized repeat protein (TIGR03803 family)